MTDQGRVLSREYDLILSDLDGVAYRGADSIDHVDTGFAEARENGTRIVFITNNSSRTPDVVADQLTALGVPTEPSEVFNSARTAVMQLAGLVAAGSKVLPIGGPGVYEALADGGFEVVSSADDEPAAVVQGLNPEATWLELSEAALAINAGAVYVATNLDATLPKERGDYLGNGSLVAAVSNATGVVPYSSGKPEPAMYQLAVETFRGERPLAVGDRLDTDIVGANKSEYPSLHVLTGVNDMRDIMLAIDVERPTYLGGDLRDLNREYPQTQRDGDEFTVGEARAKATSDSVSLNGEIIASRETEIGSVVVDLNEYRAITAAVWSLIDSGVDRDDLAWLPRFTRRA